MEGSEYFRNLMSTQIKKDGVQHQGVNGAQVIPVSGIILIELKENAIDQEAGEGSDKDGQHDQSDFEEAKPPGISLIELPEVGF
jgi:hypothetical protein